jgi:predicted phosphodiesterase
MDIHYLGQIARELTVQLGRPPSFSEMVAAGASDFGMRKVGGLTTILHSIGVPPRGAGYKKQTTAEAFYRHPEEQRQEYVAAPFKSPSTKETILVIGDTHFPWVHTECLEAIHAFNSEKKPTVIVQVGDLYDLYCHSKFPKSLNVYAPEEEERLAREGAAKMWERLIRDNPSAKCYQLLGNHDIRPAKRVQEKNPEMEHVIKAHLGVITQFPGVTTINDYRQELVIDGIVFHHGYRSQLGSHRDYTMSNFVCGHSHKGGVVYRRLKDQTIWEMNAGFVGDAESKAMSYSSQKIHDMTLGWGYIDEHGPRFIHF